MAIAALIGCHEAPLVQPAGGNMDSKVERIRKLVADLDKDPDQLHLDITPSVLALPEYGLDIVPYLHDALLSPQLLTRQHAENALARAVSRHFGFTQGKGWSRPDGQTESRALWVANGSYDARADEAARVRSVDAWMGWFRSNRSN
jgi:hypothetical protein